MDDFITSPVVFNSAAPGSDLVAEVQAKTDLLREQRLSIAASKLDNEVQKAEAELAMESFTINGQSFVNPWDYKPIGYGFDRNITGYGSGLSWRSTTNDRAEGKNAPFVEDEHDLAYIRGIARYVTEINCPALGIKENLINYIIEKGFIYTVGVKKGHQLPDGMKSAIEDIKDEFFEHNQWECEMERELFWRARRDGEFFLALHPGKSGICDLRTIEPEQVTDPAQPASREDILRFHKQNLPNVAMNNKFGIMTADHDVAKRYGYHVEWEPGDYSYFPEFYIEHHKVNVDRIQKRGMSDFFPAYRWLIEQKELLENTGAGAKKLAAIAYILQHATGVTRDQIKGMIGENADFSYTVRTAGGGTKTHRDVYRPPGSELHVPFGQEYLPGPAGHERGSAFLEVVQGMLRQTGTRWCMGEGMISGDDSNNNFASAVTAGSRFHKYAVCSQWNMVVRYTRLLWKVLRIAFNQGRFNKFGFGPEKAGSWYEFKRRVLLTVSPPDVDTRDPTDMAQTRKIELDSGLVSKKTARQDAGYDQEVEERNLAEEAAKEPVPPMPGQAGAPGAPQVPGAPGAQQAQAGNGKPKEKVGSPQQPNAVDPIKALSEQMKQVTEVVQSAFANQSQLDDRHDRFIATQAAILEINRIGADRQFPTLAEYKAAVKTVAVKVGQKMDVRPNVALKSRIDPSVFHDWKQSVQ